MDIINEKTVEMTFDEFCRGGKSITPGPWVVAEEAKIKHPEGTFIAQAQYWPDAYLIAAAPDLLEALNRVLPQYEALLKDCGLRSLGTADQARAAIAKAEGKT
jgi:hypothetical protein